MPARITEDAAPGAPAIGNQANVAAQSGVEPWAALLRQYWPQLVRLLPSHVTGDAWYSAVYAAMHRGRDDSKDYDLVRAANRNPESFILALFHSARLGHEPGTELYYLTPRPNRKAQGGLEVLGMEGYQGVIERMYRAGAVTAVRVSEVRERDEYRYEEDRDLVPFHRYKKFARNDTRGEIIGAYAYAVMQGGAISKVVEINQDDIDRAKSASGTAGKTDIKTFWNHHHDVIAMVRKTAIHQLEKWVPTSSEWRRVVADISAGARAVGASARAALPSGETPSLAHAIAAAQEATPAQIGNGERGDEPPPPPLDPTQFEQPPAPEDLEEDRTATAPPAKVAVEMQTTFAAVPDDGTAEPAAKAQLTAIGRMLKLSDAERLAVVSRLAGLSVPIDSSEQLTKPEAGQVITILGGWMDAGTFDDQVVAVLAAAKLEAEKAPS